MLKFLTTFSLCVPVMIFIEHLIGMNAYMTFMCLHALVFAAFFRCEHKEIIWWVLTILHGLAHLYHPASINGVMNVNYNPLPDFIVHGLQCLCMPYMFGVPLAIQTWVAGVVGYYHKPFLASTLWRIMSIGGVFGTQHQMLLLSRESHIYRASYLVWFLPYLGYMNYNYIPQWDYLVNSFGLFKWWYLCYYVAVKLTAHRALPNQEE